MKLTNEERQKIEKLLRDSSYAKYHKRLQIIYFRSKEKSYKEIMNLLDCNKTTVWRKMKISTFFKKSFWLTFLTVNQTVILFYLKGGLDRQYLTTESIYLVIGNFIFWNIFVAIFSNSKMWDKSWDKKSDSSKKKYILKK